MAERLKVAIDLDGTMWAHPELFSEMARALKARGHSVGILTANHVSRERANRTRLRKAGFLRPDFFISKTTEELMIPLRTWKPRVMRDFANAVAAADHARTRSSSQGGINRYARWGTHRPKRTTTA